ncbi:hypothetical protein IT568_11645 [bacterium]|nr:hypothetical protein [bacterium]
MNLNFLLNKKFNEETFKVLLSPEGFRFSVRLKSESLTFVFLLFFSTIIFAQFDAKLKQRNDYFKFGDWSSSLAVSYCYSITSSLNFAYFGTDGGVQRYDTRTGKFVEPLTTSDGLIGNKAFVVAFDDRTQTLWVSTDKGISVWYETDNKTESISKNTILPKVPTVSDESQFLISKIGFAENNVYFEIATFSQNFYFTTPIFGAGYLTFAKEFPQNLSWQGFSENTKPELENGWIFQGSYNLENNFQLSGPQFEKYQITFFFKDKYGKVFFGTNSNLFGIGNITSRFLKLQKTGLLKKEVTSIFYDGNQVVAGSRFEEKHERQGFSILDFESEEWTYFEKRFNIAIKNDRLLKVRKFGNNLWFGTFDGLLLYETDSKLWRYFSEASGLCGSLVYDFANVDGYFWVLTENGISVVDANATFVYKKFLNSDFKGKKFYKIFVEKEKVWLASECGIYSFDRKSEEILHYSSFGEKTNQLVQNPVFNLTSNGNFLFWNNETAVFRMSLESGNVEQLPTHRYPCGEEIRDILVDSYNVWLATSEGLFRFILAKNKWIHYREEDGLPSKNLFSLIWDVDFIKIGSENGLTQFYWNNSNRGDK